MKYEDYHLPSGVDLSSITYEDIRWQYGVFRCNSTGSGRYKKRFPWDGVKTNLGEIEEKDWCRLAEAVIERDGETHLLKHLIQWCSEHNYIGASAAELRKEALQLHIDRVFDNPQWGGYLPFNKRYRPEVWRAAHIVYVRNECCHKISPVTQEQIDHAYNGTIPCPHCGRWSEFIVLGIRLQPEPLVPCLNCDCHDPDMGCTMPSIDKSYAWLSLPEQRSAVVTVSIQSTASGQTACVNWTRRGTLNIYHCRKGGAAHEVQGSLFGAKPTQIRCSRLPLL